MNRRYFLRGMLGAVAGAVAARVKPSAYNVAPDMTNAPPSPISKDDWDDDWGDAYGGEPSDYLIFKAEPMTQDQWDAYFAKLEKTSKQISEWMDACAKETDAKIMAAL